MIFDDFLGECSLSQLFSAVFPHQQRGHKKKIITVAVSVVWWEYVNCQLRWVAVAAEDSDDCMAIEIKIGDLLRFSKVIKFKGYFIILHVKFTIRHLRQYVNVIANCYYICATYA